MGRSPFTAPPAPPSQGPAPGMQSPPGVPVMPPRPGAQPGRGREPAERRTLVVGRGISVQGIVSDAERLVVEGTVEATMIHATELVIAVGGVFKGEAEVEDTEVAGTIDGTLTRPRQPDRPRHRQGARHRPLPPPPGGRRRPDHRPDRDDHHPRPRAPAPRPGTNDHPIAPFFPPPFTGGAGEGEAPGRDSQAPCRSSSPTMLVPLKGDPPPCSSPAAPCCPPLPRPP